MASKEGEVYGWFNSNRRGQRRTNPWQNRTLCAIAEAELEREAALRLGKGIPAQEVALFFATDLNALQTEALRAAEKVAPSIGITTNCDMLHILYGNRSMESETMAASISQVFTDALANPEEFRARVAPLAQAEQKDFEGNPYLDREIWSVEWDYVMEVSRRLGEWVAQDPLHQLEISALTFMLDADSRKYEPNFGRYRLQVEALRCGYGVAQRLLYGAS